MLSGLYYHPGSHTTCKHISVWHYGRRVGVCIDRGYGWLGYVASTSSRGVSGIGYIALVNRPKI